jgi:hypothetical protein
MMGGPAAAGAGPRSGCSTALAIIGCTGTGSAARVGGGISAFSDDAWATGVVTSSACTSQQHDFAFATKDSSGCSWAGQQQALRTCWSSRQRKKLPEPVPPTKSIGRRSRVMRRWPRKSCRIARSMFTTTGPVVKESARQPAWFRTKSHLAWLAGAALRVSHAVDGRYTVGRYEEPEFHRGRRCLR